MTKGVLGILICPMVDDELLHYMCADKEVGRIVLIDNGFGEDLMAKLDNRGVKYDLFPEDRISDGSVVFDRDIFNIVIKSNDLGLHADPKNLRSVVEDEVRFMSSYADAIGLYYGICGNFGWDVSDWASKQGLKPVAVMRGSDGKICDDCVAIAVGSSSRYYQLEKKYTGMFYLTPAIAGNWVRFVEAGGNSSGGGMEQLKNIPKDTLEFLGIHNEMDYMRWLFEIGHYKYILKLDTGFADSGQFDKKAEEIGRTLNLKPIDVEDGWVCADTAEAIYTQCKKFLSQPSR